MCMGVCAALLVCLLTDSNPVPAQSAGPPQAPSAPAPPSGGAVQGSAGWLNLSHKTPERPSPSGITVPWGTNELKLPKGWMFWFESPATCTGCPDRTGPPITNPNALWQTSGAVSWQAGGGRIGVRLTGQRGARLPLFMIPSGSATGVPMASDVNMSDPRTQWVITLSAERAVLASRAYTLSVFGDLFLPLGSIGQAPTTRDVRTPAQTAIIGGVRIRSKAPLP